MGILVSASHSSESHNGWARKQYDFTSSSLLRTIFQGISVVPLTKLAAMKICPRCKKDLIIHQKPFKGYIFPLVFAPVFNIVINIHEYKNEIKFSNRSMTSIYLSHDIITSAIIVSL